MGYAIHITCPECGAPLSKDFRDVLRKPIGCSGCESSFTLTDLKQQMDPEDYKQLQKILQTKAQAHYGSLSEIQEKELRVNAYALHDLLTQTPAGLLIDKHYSAVPYPTEYRNTLNRMIALEVIDWHGTPGNEYVTLKHDKTSETNT